AWIIAIVLAILLVLIFFVGINSIVNVATTVVPFMTIIYKGFEKLIINLNLNAVISLIALIFKLAFDVEVSFGGIFGAMIEIGVKRGLYSNEAGQGTGPHAAATTEVSHPAKQGLVQAFSVYIDTLLVCTATAIMILMTGTFNTTDGATN